MTLNNRAHGFTLIELLVIVAFTGMLMSIGGVLLNSIRFKDSDISKLRDARRLQDLTSLRTGLELYSAQAGGYPDMSLWHAGGVINCNKDKLLNVPNDPLASSPYKYLAKGIPSVSKSCGDKVWTDYAVQFQTEELSSLGVAGTYCLTPSRGFALGPCK